MKKLSTLIVAFLLTAGMAYAQNTASISQTGNNAVADIDQTGSNEAIITQVTDGLDVSSSIVQVGINNTASTDLTAGDLNHFGATTVQSQEGDDNTASIVATNTTQEMSASQTQLGNRNQAIVVTKHNAIVEQTQTGHDNYAEADIVGKAMRTTQIQTGDFNRATMSAGNATVGSTYQEQLGDHNTSEINSFSSHGSARSYVDTYQEGDLNTATVNFGPAENTADVDQIGNGNNALINFESGSKKSNGEADVDQFGNDNLADISLFGDDNNASQWVAGDNNKVYQSQKGNDNHQRTEITGSGNTYTTSQDGDDNRAYVNSRGTGSGNNSSFSYVSTFNATQEGDNNLISGSMGGDENTLNILQEGNSNMVSGGLGHWDAAGFTIEGNHNTASISQYSDGNSATLSMIGNSNTATITQSGQVQQQ